MKPPTRIFTYGLRAPREGAEDLHQQLRAGHNYYNARLEIERSRVQAEEDFWAQRGGYMDLLEESRKAQALRPRKDDPEKKAIWARQKELRKKVWEAQERTEDQLLPKEEVFRKQRATELRKEYKEQGVTLSKKELSDILDKDPRCVSERRQAQLDYEADANRRGVKVSGKGCNAYLRRLGFTKTTQEIEDFAHEETLRAKEHFGLYYGTQLLIEEQVDKALSTTEKPFPDFKRWDGTGRVGAPVDTNKGLRVQQVFENNSVLQIDPIDPSVYDRSHEERNVPRGHGESWRMRTRTTLRICVNALPRKKGQRTRNSVWVTFDMILHRPLPEKGKICAAWIKVFKHGTQTRYALQLQVQSEALQPKPRHGEGVTAINFGYRSNGRVAYTVNGQGIQQEYRISSNISRLIDIADEVRSTRDNAANLTRDSLHDWVRELGVPQVFALHEEAKVVPHWSGRDKDKRTLKARSLHERIELLKNAREQSLPSRLRSIFLEWERLREQGLTRDIDERIFGHLREWYIADRRYENSESGARIHASRARNQEAQLWAHSLCDEADVILVENTNYAALKMKPKDDSMPVEVQTEIARRRDFFAPGTFREIVQRVAHSRGVLVVRVDPSDLTQRHHACGHKEKRNTVSSITVRCTHCDQVFDQDLNFCQGLRERYRGGNAPKPRKSRNSSKSL